MFVLLKEVLSISPIIFNPPPVYTEHGSGVYTSRNGIQKQTTKRGNQKITRFIRNVFNRRKLKTLTFTSLLHITQLK